MNTTDFDLFTFCCLECFVMGRLYLFGMLHKIGYIGVLVMWGCARLGPNRRLESMCIYIATLYKT